MHHHSEHRRTALTLLFLCFVAWAAHYSLSGRFLLYEDDYAVMGRSLDMDLAALWGILRSLWLECPMARPLHFSFGRVFAYLGFQWAGLQGMYGIAWAIICLNTVLVFSLLKKMAPGAVAFFGALSFLLFPADTTKPLLTHALMIQPGVTCLLAALLIYTGKRPWLSYATILGALLTYEPTALPFLAAPLLKKPWDRQRMKKLAHHILIIFSLMALAGGVRLMVHEARMNDLASGHLPEAAAKALASTALGPLTIIWSYAARMFDGAWTVRPWGALMGGLFLVMGIPLAMALQQAGVRAQNIDPRIVGFKIKSRVLDFSFQINTTFHHRGIFRLLVTGMAMRFCSYLLAFSYWPPMITAGRETCVHIAASVGSSMVFAAVAWLFMIVCKAYEGRWGGILALCAYLSLLVCFHTTVQESFAKSAYLQRSFWRQTIALCPDVEEGTVILVREEGLPKAKYIRSNFWTDRLVLELMYDFPAEWKDPPQLYVMDYRISHSFRQRPNGEILWDRPVPPPENVRPSVLKPGNVILLEMEEGRLVRRFGAGALGPDLRVQLKPKGDDLLNSLSTRPLFALISNKQTGKPD